MGPVHPAAEAEGCEISAEEAGLQAVPYWLDAALTPHALTLEQLQTSSAADLDFHLGRSGGQAVGSLQACASLRYACALRAPVSVASYLLVLCQSCMHASVCTMHYIVIVCRNYIPSQVTCKRGKCSGEVQCRACMQDLAEQLKETADVVMPILAASAGQEDAPAQAALEAAGLPCMGPPAAALAWSDRSRWCLCHFKAIYALLKQQPSCRAPILLSCSLKSLDPP